MSDKTPTRVLDFIKSTQWAIHPDSLKQIFAIANRMNENPQLLNAQTGVPLNNTRNVTVRDGVAIIPVVGPIFRYANLFTEVSGATSLESLAKDFKQAELSNEAQNIVFNIDSPGGMAAGIAEFAGLIRESSKPTAAYIGDKGHSAAYWIASACDRVYMSKTASAGSVGAVLTVQPGAEDGSLTFVSSVSPKKRLDVFSEEGQATLQNEVDALGKIFVEDVANFRNVSPSTVLNDFGQGGTKLGAEAVAAGMADGLTSLETLLTELTTDKSNRINFSMTTKTYKASELTREILAAENPQLLEALEKTAADVALSENAESLRAEGAEKERMRIQSVQEQALPGYEADIAAMMFDGKTTGEHAAVAILKKEKEAQSKHVHNMQTGSIEPVESVADETRPAFLNNEDESLPLDERIKATWDNDPALRTEFNGSFEAYSAYRTAEDAGLIKLRQHTAKK